MALCISSTTSGEDKQFLPSHIDYVKLSCPKMMPFVGEYINLHTTFDQSLSFKHHVKALCKKAGQKLHALARISRYMDTEKLQQLMRAFILSHFSYCPLVWMFFDRTLDHRINRVQERALRIAYKDYGSDFGLLLKQTKSVRIHVRNLQLLMTEMYKTKSDLNPPFMKDIFMERNISYNLRHGSDAQLPKVRTTSFGIETTVYLGNKTVAAYTSRSKRVKHPSYFQKTN